MHGYSFFLFIQYEYSARLFAMFYSKAYKCSQTDFDVNREKIERKTNVAISIGLKTNRKGYQCKKNSRFL